MISSLTSILFDIIISLCVAIFITAGAFMMATFLNTLINLWNKNKK